MKIKIALVTFGFLFLGLLFQVYLMKIPSAIKELSHGSTKILARDGKVIAKLYSNGRSEKVELSNVNSEFIDLLLLAEDKRFYLHNGVDFEAMYRALWNGIINLKISSGASTLTQQLVRILYGYPRTVWGKIQVMLHALKVEKHLTKGQILEAYLNYVPFSHQKIGMLSASEFYFNKNINALNLSEISTLVAMIKSPSYYSSARNHAKLFKQKNILLKRYFVQNKLETWQQQVLLSEDIYFYGKNKLNTAHHFVRYLKANHSLELDTIRTTLNLELQNTVQKILSRQINALREYDVTNGAVLVIDNTNGDVLAYVGSYDFFDNEFGQIDAIQTPRQPGSTMKPFTYALGLQNGFSAGSILPDIPFYYSANAGSIKPRNYSNSYLGPVTLRVALGNSLNLPALYVTDKLGVSSVKKFMESFAFKFPKDAEYYGVGLTIGNAETSLWDLVYSYSAFANEGKYLLPRLISHEKVQLKKSKMNFLSAQIINDILSDDRARHINFGEGNLFETPYHLAIKTGTSTLFRDNWTIGYNRKYVVGVWVGNMDQQPMHNVSGITGAGPVLRQVFDELMKNTKSRSFEKSKMLVKSQICSKSGALATAQCPEKHEEIFMSEHKPTHQCNQHLEVEVRSCFDENDKTMVTVASYSEKYREWATKMGVYDIHDQVAMICATDSFHIINDQDESSMKAPSLEIISPLDGNIYGKDPSIAKRFQKIPFKIYGNLKVKQITWILNDKVLFKGPNSSHLWPVKRGNYHLQANIQLYNGQTITRNAKFNVL